MSTIIYDEKTNAAIELTDKYFVRKADQKKFRAFIPDEDLGLYKSLLILQDKGYDINGLVELDIVYLNPTRYE